MVLSTSDNSNIIWVPRLKIQRLTSLDEIVCNSNWMLMFLPSGYHIHLSFTSFILFSININRYAEKHEKMHNNRAERKDMILR